LCDCFVGVVRCVAGVVAVAPTSHFDDSKTMMEKAGIEKNYSNT